VSGGPPDQRSGLDRGYVVATRAFSAVMTVVGVTIVAVTLANGGGPLATGLLMGLLFIALGAGRLYLSLRSR
jgi:hypothetical protein